MISGELPDGCLLTEQKVFTDQRGWLYEGFKEEDMPVPLKQFTIGQSVAGSFRGMHVHNVRHDYLCVMTGSLTLGLIDLRKGSPTFKKSCLVTLTGEDSITAYIPPGVAHGFAFKVDTIYLTGLNPHYSGDDEVSLRYDDPAVGLDWGFEPTILSSKDEQALSLDAAIEEYTRRALKA